MLFSKAWALLQYLTLFGYCFDGSEALIPKVSYSGKISEKKWRVLD
jgi:hypothetical protein